MDFAQSYGPWALVTGASSGLGERYARALAARGLNLIVIARRKERLRTLAEELHTEHGVQVDVVATDLLKARSMRAIEEAVEGRELGLVVCNAGFGASGRFHELDRNRQIDMVRLNCEAPVRLLHALSPYLIQRGHGGVIMLASTASFQCTPWMAVYGATKAFDLHFAEALTVELGLHGIDVLSVCPGHTATEFHEVAGVDRSATGGAPADPTEVVEQSLRKLGHKMTWTHGARNRWMSFATRLAPRSISAWIAGKILHKRLN
ncbi:MAG: SDR family oxidoreductase [Planctomycetes bacterium]|nr:SDR family oxidoreductase [Planctomycetota bacterium]